MSRAVDQTTELNKVVDIYIGSDDPQKHKKYARVICFILTYLPGERVYKRFLGENKLTKTGLYGAKVGSGFIKLIESHKKKSKSDSLYEIRREVMDCFHGVELNYVVNLPQKNDLANILKGFKKLSEPIDNTLCEGVAIGNFQPFMIKRVYNGLKAAKIDSIGDLFENYGGEWKEKVLRFRNIGPGTIGVIDKIIEDTGLDTHMSSEEYKLLKRLSL